MGGAGRAYVGGESCVQGLGVERDYLGDPGIDGRIILRWIFRNWNVGVWTELCWLRMETSGGHL
jgi:hypothetical protein